MPDSSDITITPSIVLPRAALQFRYARSSGPGGQNVNKLNTKATLTVVLSDLASHLPLDAVDRLARQARAYVTEAGLQISCDESRSQVANRDACIERLVAMIRQALVRPKKRRPTKPTRASRERRLTGKQQRGEKKRLRQRPRPRNDDV